MWVHGAAALDPVRQLSTHRNVFVDAMHWRVQIVHSDSELVVFQPEGGGVPHQVSRSAFLSAFKPVMDANFSERRVRIEGASKAKTFTAFVNGETFGGWCLPRFSYETASQIASALGVLRYEALEDRFVTDYGLFSMDDPVAFDCERIRVDGNLITVYPIGARVWSWEICDRKIRGMERA